MVVYKPSKRKGINRILLAYCVPLHPNQGSNNPAPRIPGGGSKFEETQEETAIRELFEETGLQAKSQAKIVRVYQRPFGVHIKCGFLAARSEFEGSIRHRNPPKDQKVKFVGYRWLTFAEALEEITPYPGSRSQHDILVDARDELIRMGLENPVAPPKL